MAIPASGVALSVATGALTLVDPATLEPRALRLYRTSIAALVGWTTYDALSEGSDDVTIPSGFQAAVSVAATAGTAAVIERLERSDARLHRWLGRRGVRHPRRVTAALSTVLSLAVVALDERTRKAAATEEFDAPALHEQPLDPSLRAVLERILAGTEEYGAAALRRQLDVVRSTEGPDEDQLVFLDLLVDEDAVAERAVPRDFTFPVAALFRHGGERYAVRLGVTAGLMSEVMVQPEDPESDPSVWPTSWPAATEIELQHDADVG